MKRNILLTTIPILLVLMISPTAAAIEPSELVDLIGRSVEGDACTTSSSSQTLDWYWTESGVRDPQLGAFYKADVERVAHLTEGEHGGCYETSYTCKITVDDGGSVAFSTGGSTLSSEVTIQWVRGGDTTVDGSYRGIPFAGSSGSCSSSSVSFTAWTAYLAQVRGEGTTP